MVVPLFKPGLVKVDYAFSLGGRTWHIIRWIDSGSALFAPYTATDLDSLALQCQDAIAGVQAFTTTDTTFEGTTTTDFTSDLGLVGTATAGGGGTEAPPALPIQCAAEIDWKIARRYRGGHPKSFLSGIAEARQTSNRDWTSGFVSGLQTAANTWSNDLSAVAITHGASTEVFTHVNSSKFTAHSERPSVVVDPIVEAVVNGVISSQRRRRGRI